MFFSLNGLFGRGDLIVLLHCLLRIYCMFSTGHRKSMLCPGCSSVWKAQSKESQFWSCLGKYCNVDSELYLHCLE